MRRAVLMMAAGAMALAATVDGAAAASLASSSELRRAAEAVDVTVKAFYRCQRVQVCDPGGCWWKRECWRNCPDGISCYPLYGHYGPYGGIGYWGAYTFTGWGPPRR